jgi:hypothetical protein
LRKQLSGADIQLVASNGRMLPYLERFVRDETNSLSASPSPTVGETISDCERRRIVRSAFSSFE